MDWSTVIGIGVFVGILCILGWIGAAGGWAGLHMRAAIYSHWAARFGDRMQLTSGPKLEAAAARFADTAARACKVPENEFEWAKLRIMTEFKAAVRDFYVAEVRESI